MAKKVCIPIAEAKRLGIKSATKARSLKQLLSTPEGKTYRDALRTAERDVSKRNASCSTSSYSARLVSSAASKFIGTHANELSPGSKRAIEKRAKSFSKRSALVCKRIESALAKAKKLESLKGRR
jgi:RNA polymerase-interacting CarD/CdnL/TRCF family regulator